MPRELYLVTAEPVTFEAVVRAAAEVDDALALRGLYDGRVLQLVGTGGSFDAVLSLQSSRQLVDTFDVGRVTRGLELPEGFDEGGWWTEALAPWGPVGDPGVAVMTVLADRLDGRLRVEDGT